MNPYSRWGGKAVRLWPHPTEVTTKRPKVRHMLALSPTMSEPPNLPAGPLFGRGFAGIMCLQTVAAWSAARPLLDFKQPLESRGISKHSRRHWAANGGGGGGGGGGETREIWAYPRT